MGLPSLQECVFVLLAGDCGLAFLFTGEKTAASVPPAAVKTVLENQSKVSTQELTLEKTPLNNLPS